MIAFKDFNKIQKLKTNEQKQKEWLKDYLKNPETYEKYILFMRKTKPKGVSLRDYERMLFEKG